ncbi:MAG: cytochrome c [Spirochaetota bacterium]|nr:cytochrome c [Spirochaetota bacterium]
MKNLLWLKFIIICIAVISCERQSSDNVKKNLDYSQSSLGLMGKKVYQMHCVNCHSLRGEGGAIGPSLDDLARNMDGTYIRESILEPNRLIKPGYKRDIMPTNYGKLLSEKELDALIFYITNQ